jgi:hypothetical protein
VSPSSSAVVWVPLAITRPKRVEAAKEGS